MQSGRQFLTQFVITLKVDQLFLTVATQWVDPSRYLQLQLEQVTHLMVGLQIQLAVRL